MHTKLLPVLFLLASLLPLASAQQLPLFTQYREMQGAINPAIVGDYFVLYKHQAYVGSSVRIQWEGREGAPRTQILHGEYLPTKNNFNLLTGGYILNDQAGQIGSTGVYGRLASVYFVKKKKPSEGGFATGMNIGIVQFRINFEGVVARDEKDPILAAGDYTKIHRDVGLGIYGWRELDVVTVFGGLSIPQALGINLRYKTKNDTLYSLERVRHYYALAGFKSQVGEHGAIFEMTTWGKYVPYAPFHLDLNLRLYREMDNGAKLWLGAGINTAKALHGEIGLMPDGDQKVRIGYSFDYILSDKILKFGNSHEINVGIAMGRD